MDLKNRHNTKAFRENPLICGGQFPFMKSSHLLIYCIFLFTLGCSKDKFLTNPSLRLQSYTSTVPINGNFNAVLQYSQKNGKIDGDSLTMIRHRYNLKPIADPNQETSDTFLTILSSSENPIPDANSAQFSVSLNWQFIQIDNGENDTIDFRFFLTDLAGRVSDTVRTGKIVLLH